MNETPPWNLKGLGGRILEPHVHFHFRKRGGRADTELLGTLKPSLTYHILWSWKEIQTETSQNQKVLSVDQSDPHDDFGLACTHTKTRVSDAGECYYLVASQLVREAGCNPTCEE